MAGDYRAAKSAAYHEAGHAVAALHVGMSVRRVAIAPCCDKKNDGVCECEGNVDDFPNVVFVLAGFAAERKFNQEAHEFGASGDRARVKQILAKRYGRVVDSLDQPIVKAAQHEADRVVSLRWPDIEILAAELIKRFEIEGKEVRQIVAVAATKRITAEIERLKA